MSNNKHNEENTSYFMQYGHGLGYLNEIREIPNSGTPPRHSARIAALQGSSESIHNEYHDLTIDSAITYALLFHYQNEIEDTGCRKNT